MVLGDSIGLLWIIAPYPNPSSPTFDICIIGPVLSANISKHFILKHLTTKVPLLKDEFLRQYPHLPIIPRTQMLQYGIMLHYCLTGKQILISDLIFPVFCEENQKVYRVKILMMMSSDQEMQNLKS